MKSYDEEGNTLSEFDNLEIDDNTFFARVREEFEKSRTTKD